MRHNGTLTVMLLALMSVKGAAQNRVGIGTSNPNEKLEVSGIIYSNQGGVRFPDETLQETAAFNDFEPEDAGMPRGQVYVQIQTMGPPISETIWLLDVSQGGFEALPPDSLGRVPFVMTKEIDTTSIRLFQKMVMGIKLDKFTLHYTNPAGMAYQTIELREATLSNIGYRDVFVGDDRYAHLEDLEVGYEMMEIKRPGPGADPCFCWNFVTNAECICD